MTGLRCRYVVEPRPGLSRARNRALAEADADIVAWLDDDEVADPGWIAWLRHGFAHPARPTAVCGLMLPAEMKTEAQVRFEQYGGFNKGRDLMPEVLRAGTETVRNPLYPLPGFGPGGNMAFRPDAVRGSVASTPSRSLDPHPRRRGDPGPRPASPPRPHSAALACGRDLAHAPADHGRTRKAVRRLLGRPVGLLRQHVAGRTAGPCWP